MVSFCRTRLYRTWLLHTTITTATTITTVADDTELEGGGGELLSAWRSWKLPVASQEASPPSSPPAAPSSSSSTLLSPSSPLTGPSPYSQLPSFSFDLLKPAGSWKMSNASDSYQPWLSRMLVLMLTMFTMKARSFPSGHSKVSTVTLRVTLRRGLHTRNSHSGGGSTFVNMG